VDPVFFATPSEFRAWLEQHHATEPELLVGFCRMATGRPSMTWAQSVDEALCFGWIDGVRRSHDADSYTIRFTPRKAASNWSTVNVRRIGELAGHGLVAPAGQAAFERRTGLGVLRRTGALVSHGGDPLGRAGEAGRHAPAPPRCAHGRIRERRARRPSRLAPSHQEAGREPGKQGHDVTQVPIRVTGRALPGPGFEQFAFAVRTCTAARFLYLSWGELRKGEFTMFRRAKLQLPDPADGPAGFGAELPLTAARGGPLSRPCGRR
jgi:hypothetical protein